jgi:acyl carrier protein
MITLEMLEPIFREVFDDNAVVLNRDTTADNIDAWDSISHMNLVLALELRFKIKFALGELKTLKNVGEMLDLINKKCSK